MDFNRSNFNNKVYGDYAGQTERNVYKLILNKFQTKRILTVAAEFIVQTKRIVTHISTYTGQALRHVRKLTEFSGQTFRKVIKIAAFDGQTFRKVVKMAEYQAQTNRIVYLFVNPLYQTLRKVWKEDTFLGQTLRKAGIPIMRIINLQGSLIEPVVENQDFTVWAGNDDEIIFTFDVDIPEHYFATWALARNEAAQKLITKTLGNGVRVDGKNVIIKLDPEDTKDLWGEFYHELESRDGVLEYIKTTSIGYCTIKHTLIS